MMHYPCLDDVTCNKICAAHVLYWCWGERERERERESDLFERETEHLWIRDAAHAYLVLWWGCGGGCSSAAWTRHTRRNCSESKGVCCAHGECVSLL